MREPTRPRTLLQQLILHRDVTYEGVIGELETFARTQRIDGTISLRHLQRLARLERGTDGAAPTALPGTRRLLRAFFDVPFEELLGPPLPTEPPVTTDLVPHAAAAAADPRSIAAAAARESLDFLAWAQDDRVPEAVLQHVSSELRRIAVDYVHRPVAPLFADLVDLRDMTFGLLKDRPHPGQSRELFFVAGTVCTLLAHSSQNMGSSAAARTQAATAWACAEQADHADLRAWVCGTQALIAEWSDDLDAAVRFARQGQHHAVSKESQVRLAAIEARTLARAGDTDGAVAAIHRAQQARGQADRPNALAEFGGILTFPEVKQLYYAGSTLALVGRHAEAENAALAAVHLYETGPAADRSYGDEALARVDVALARTAADDLDGARSALTAVLALPASHRIQQITHGLQRVQDRLTQPRYTSTVLARELLDDIAEFSSVAGRP
jgi:hypothetical protein